ncbi:uncharacterized protein LOC124449282 [Xenia sp. Carnegie-2017]|uniref:uncharacterized protein LOC124449282 n=1 Tax=Xenia sp. Carnegie-2017 TaxID=2897299 RepID=UPI001F05059A|nr:uncharacterized protein LOC124449282 [Xenia sp. Carnegie-2017]
MSEKPLTPWVVCEKNGKVLTAHCDCMAGIGESCSHVASLLLAVEAGARKRDSLTVTDKKAYWVLPSAVKAVPYAKFRAGRVTASRFKAACRTNRDSPSKSLITSICYPKLKKFSTAETRWGCQHEEVAKDEYRKWLNTNHENVSVTNSGFWIHLTHGFLGASPDGLVSCQCCGTGICEIKCPFCHKDETIETSTDDRLFCIEVKSDGTKQLKRTHAYYYQVHL